jgi:hypothetical protein
LPKPIEGAVHPSFEALLFACLEPLPASSCSGSALYLHLMLLLLLLLLLRARALVSATDSRGNCLWRAANPTAPAALVL